MGVTPLFLNCLVKMSIMLILVLEMDDMLKLVHNSNFLHIPFTIN